MNLNKIKRYFTPTRILDIGANVGQFHQAAKQAFPDAYIYSIEANEDCRQSLSQITDDFAITLLTAKPGTYDFYTLKNGPSATGNSVYKELTDHYSDDKVEIVKAEGKPLSYLFPPESYFDLIKIDVQGAELDVMEGGRSLCSKAKAILLETSLIAYNEGAPNLGDVAIFMDQLGFSPIEVIDETHIPGQIWQQDILFIRRPIDEQLDSPVSTIISSFE